MNNPVVVRFGRGSRSEAAGYLIDNNILFITSRRGRKIVETDFYLKEIIAKKKIVWIDTISSYIDKEELNQIIKQLGKNEINYAIGVGGGAVIDAAKIITYALNNEKQYRTIEQLIRRCPIINLAKKKTKLIIIPTTAGTGSEVTQYATVWDKNLLRKESITGKDIFPEAAFVDPDLVDSVPVEVAIESGLDAINQAFESMLNINRDFISETYATEALRKGVFSLFEIIKNPKNSLARENMQRASLLAGLAISRTKTSICHAISYPLTLHFQIPHGLACAFTMPAVLKHSLKHDLNTIKILKYELIGKHDAHDDELVMLFQKLNNYCEVNKKIKLKIKDRNDIKKYEKEMINIERSGNSTLNVNERLITEIIDDAWGIEG
jgi:alcohol dehydrogenase class IV